MNLTEKEINSQRRSYCRTSTCLNCLEEIYFGIPRNWDGKYRSEYVPQEQWRHSDTHIGACARTYAEPINAGLLI